MLSRSLVGLTAWLAAACGGGAPTARSGGECSERLPGADATLSAGPAPDQPPSRVVLALSGRRERLERELEQRVPVVLAEARGADQGVAGELTYRVVREGIALGLEGDKLVGTTVVKATVSACKRLGPLCVEYASCTPRVAVRAAVPLRLDGGFGVPASEAAFRTLEGCQVELFGYDATGEVERAARKGIADLRARIDARLPRLGSDVDLLWRMLALPVAVDGDSCLRVAPGRVVQGAPSMREGGIHTSVGVEATVALEQPCADVRGEPGRPPPPHSEAGLDGTTRLRLPASRSWVDVNADLTRTLGRVPGLVAVRARGVTVGGARRVALDVTLGSSPAGSAGTACGTVTLLGEPWFDATRERLRLRGITLAPGARAAVDAEAVAPTLAAIEERAAIALPVLPSVLERAARGLLEGAATQVPRGITARREVGVASVGEIHATSATLQVVLELEAKLGLSLD